METKTACTTVTDFFMKIVDHKIELDKDHDYYSQVQGQLMIRGANYCEFIVYTQCDMVVQRIKPDVIYIRDMLEKLSTFFKEFAKPFLNSLPVNLIANKV